MNEDQLKATVQERYGRAALRVVSGAKSACCGAGEASLDDQVEYRNSKGELWRSRVEDILTHVLFHSTYHRGQIALLMRASGMEPAYTDFIHAVRQRFVE